MLAGSTPYSGSVSTVMEAHIKEDVPPLKKVNPNVPDDVCEIAGRMMAKEPNDRYQAFEVIFEDLEYARLNLTGDSGGDLMLRSKSTLYSVIKMEKTKARKHLADSIELEQKLRVTTILFWSLLAYSVVSTIFTIILLTR